MQRFGLCVGLACALAAGCGASKSDGDSPIGGNGGASAGATASGGSPLLDVGGAGAVGNSGGAGSASPDIDSVQAPNMRCTEIGSGGRVGGSDDSDEAGKAGNSASAGEGGAADGPWNEGCLPPPSQCIGDRTLVFFDEGECVRGRCAWVKKSMNCQNACFGGGCQDSITTR